MRHHPVNLKDKLSLIQQHWSPRVVAEMNDYQFKLAKIEGAFVWHDHPDTDETFLVIEGEMTMQLCDEEIQLATGDLYVVPRGVEHRPVAEHECHILLIEPRGVVNTGDAGGELTAEPNVWI